ncbi:MAG: winged helix-turn-helix transcriptional regulator [Candidatus Thorarchaeota archaeon]|jgi:predicted transcriptional regulator
MGRIGRRIAVAIAAALVMTSLFAIFMAGGGPGNGALAVKEASEPALSTISNMRIDMVTATVSGGTLALFPDVMIDSLYTYVLFLIVGTVAAERREEIRNKKLRDRVTDEIASSPGIHLRELHRVLGCAMGALQYHLISLEREAEVMSIRHGNTKHFFPNSFSIEDSVLRLAASARNPTIRSILTEGYANGRMTQAELSRTLAVDKSLISYYTSQLVRLDVLNTIKVFGRERPLILSDWARDAIETHSLLVH